jgi:RNA polymerase sigma-70 factor (ECF subfamily)
MPSRDARATDAQLLDSFLRHKNKASFEALVTRHGPMVWAVCRRVLGHVQDTEDAFQSTFLALLRKAETLKSQALVGSWLYRVACRTAMRARARSSKRRVKEKQVKVLPQPAASQQRFDDALGVLDEELSRLPPAYRATVVLCDLEGKTHRAAAHLLGWPVGTVSTRLFRGRQMLAKRLVRRGIVASGLAVALGARQMACAAPFLSELAASTVRSAAESLARAQTEVASAIVASPPICQTPSPTLDAGRVLPKILRAVAFKQFSLGAGSLIAMLIAGVIVGLGTTVGAWLYTIHGPAKPLNCDVPRSGPMHDD